MEPAQPEKEGGGSGDMERNVGNMAPSGDIKQDTSVMSPNAPTTDASNRNIGGMEPSVGQINEVIIEDTGAVPFSAIASNNKNTASPLPTAPESDKTNLLASESDVTDNDTDNTAMISPDISNPKLYDFSLSPVVFKWRNDSASLFNTSGYATVPLRSFLFIYNNTSIKHFAERNSTKLTSPRFTIVVTSLKNHNPIEKISAANRGISSLYKSCVGCPFSEEYRQTIPVRDNKLLIYLVNRHDTVNVQICCELSNGSKETVAALSFIETKTDELVILFAAVTAKLYDNSFGSGNDGEPFRRKGLFTFLLSFCRLFILSNPQYIPKSPIVVHALVLPTDPFRRHILRPLGFRFASATIKHLLPLFGTSANELLPVTGNKLVYSLVFGKDLFFM